MSNLRWIRNDLFSIARRLKEIDRWYRVAFNVETERFEVHNLRQAHTLCLVVPYETLDARTVNMVRKTHVSRADELLAEMEKHNSLLEKQKDYEVGQKVMARVEETLCKSNQ